MVGEVAQASGPPVPRRALSRTRSLARRVRVWPASELSNSVVPVPSEHVIQMSDADGREIPHGLCRLASLRQLAPSSVVTDTGASPPSSTMTPGARTKSCSGSNRFGGVPGGAMPRGREDEGSPAPEPAARD
jgi:hypothetical protein